MEINSKVALDIFENNFEYVICDTILGKAIRMNCYDAFLYANVTGAGYLDNYVMPFSPKGLLKIFYNAFDYNFVTGVFDDGNLKYTPYNLSITKPFLFSGDKYIIFVEFASENELRTKLKEFINICEINNINKTDFIIQRIETSKVGNGMESFLEYIACEHFRKEGYIVENQIPLAATVGSPDFAGYSLYELNKVENISKIFSNGFHIIELSMLRLKKDILKSSQIVENGNIVGEAKTSTTKMASQLEKYLKTGLFSIGFEMHPDKANPTYNHFGLLTIQNNKIIVEYPKTFIKYELNYSSVEYEKWLMNYVKFYLIANFTNDELLSFYQKSNDSKISESNLIEFISNITVEEILQSLEEVI